MSNVIAFPIKHRRCDCGDMKAAPDAAITRVNGSIPLLRDCRRCGDAIVLPPEEAALRLASENCVLCGQVPGDATNPMHRVLDNAMHEGFDRWHWMCLRCLSRMDEAGLAAEESSP
jgi:hypothetical protein